MRLWSKLFLVTLGLVAVETLSLCRLSAADRPSVLFILADDLGWRDLSISGSEFHETPHIDRIGASGVQFVQGYATCQVCSPSRASLLTGQYPDRLHITDWIGAKSGYEWKRNGQILPASYLHELPAENITVAEAFLDAGYSTFFAGKWHLGGEGALPTNHGFEINLGGHHRGSPPGGFFAPYKNPKLEDGSDGESLPLRLGHETANFIRSKKDQPFFAFLSFYSVHALFKRHDNVGDVIKRKQRKLRRRQNDSSSTAPCQCDRFRIVRSTPA